MCPRLLEHPVVAASGIRRNILRGGERTQDLAKDGGTTGGLWAKPPASIEFLWFSHKKKTLTLAHIFVEKGHAVSAITLDNAKIFLPLISESRSLAKISERRLQSLLVCEIIG